MVLFLRIFLVLSALFGAGTQASAQEFNEIQAVIKPWLNINKARSMRHLTREIGRDRWLASYGVFDSAGGMTVTSASHGMGGIYSGSHAATDSAGWNIWLDGNGGWLEDTAPLRAYDGSQWSVSLGADTQLTERIIIGGILNHTGSDVDNVFLPGNSKTSAFSAGPYAAVFLTDTLVLTGSFLYSWTQNDASSFAVASSWDSESWAGNATLTSYHQLGNWLVAPTIGISYDEEREDAYFDTAPGPTFFPAVRTRTGTFAFGGAVSRSFALDGGVVLTPELSVEAEWIFLNATTATSSVAADTRDFDVNATVGTDIEFSEAVSFSISGTVSGLANPTYLSVTAGGRLTVSF
ncbi:MAG: autotransporter outer membrane beta-barrel domain-containing protein [Rhizobiaceae bacterium]